MLERNEFWTKEFHAGFAGELIRRKVQQIRLRYRLNSHDADDLLQELRLEVWRRSRHYDPARGTWPAFVTTVVQHQSATLCRRLMQLKTGRAQSVPLTQDLLETRPGKAGMGESQSDVERTCDLETIRQQLDFEQQMVLQMLQMLNVSDTARVLGTPRSTFVDRVRAMLSPLAPENLHKNP